MKYFTYFQKIDYINRASRIVLSRPKGSLIGDLCNNFREQNLSIVQFMYFLLVSAVKQRTR